MRASAQRWLLFVHQLPSTPSNLRVKAWRRMQQLGAIAIKQAVYVLPDSPDAREDFEWLKTEVMGAGGEVNVFVADTVDRWSSDELIEAFRRARQEAYTELAQEIEPMLRRSHGRGTQRANVRDAQRHIDTLRARLGAVEAIDFFGSAGRDRVLKLLQQLEAQMDRPERDEPPTTMSGTRATASYQRRLWVTRPRPGVDRMSSAWLIRRFIDAEARFDFVADRAAAPRDALPFDMFGVEFSHHADHCTFETLCRIFGLADPTLARMAAIVHDLDLKDARFGAPEAAAVGLVIDGLQLAHADDQALLSAGMALFEALYRGVEQSARTTGPTPVARRLSPRTTARARTPRRPRGRSS